MRKPKEDNFSTFFGGYAKIYTLSKLNGDVFYVGCTIQQMESRVYSHICEAKATGKSQNNNRKNTFLREIGLNFSAEIIDTIWVTGKTGKHAINKASDLEKFYIDKYRGMGYDLVNKQPIVFITQDTQNVGKHLIVSNGSVVTEKEMTATRTEVIKS